MNYPFPRENRLRKRHEYQNTWQSGRKLHTKNFLIVICRNDHSALDRSSRIGITVSRKVGGAVVRNRVKRRIREFSRLHYRRLPSVADISIIARPGAADISSSQLNAELKILFTVDVTETFLKD